MKFKINQRLVATAVFLALSALTVMVTAQPNENANGTPGLNAQGLDSQIAAAAPRIATLEGILRSIKPANSAGQCRQTFSIDAMAKDPGMVTVYSKGSAPLAKTMIQAVACNALLTGDGGTCLAMNPQNPFCPDLLTMLATHRIIALHGADPERGRRLCSTAMRNMPPSFCSVVENFGSDPRQLEPRLRELFPQMTPAQFAENFRMSQGLADANYCRAIGQTNWARGQGCTTLRTLAAAKNNPNLCGSDGFCRAIFGAKTGSCEVYIDPIRDNYCQHFATKASDTALVKVRLEVADIQRGLQRISQSVRSHQASDTGEDAANRRRRVAGLLKRCDVMITSINTSLRHSAPVSR